MPRENIPKSSLKKLEQFFTKTLGKAHCLSQTTVRLVSRLDTNNDGLVNWTDFEAAIEVRLARRIRPRTSFSKLVDRVERRSREERAIENLTQTSRATLSEVFLGSMRHW